MTVETDAGGGRAVGSRLRLSGRVLGMNLAAEGEVGAEPAGIVEHGPVGRRDRVQDRPSIAGDEVHRERHGAPGPA